MSGGGGGGEGVGIGLSRGLRTPVGSGTKSRPRFGVLEREGEFSETRPDTKGLSSTRLEEGDAGFTDGADESAVGGAGVS